METAAEILGRLKRKSLKTSQRQTKTRSIRGTYSLPPEALERNRELILRIEAEQEKCEGCNGVCRKEGSSKGFYPTITVEGNDIQESLTMCAYEKQQREQARITRLFRSSGIPRFYEKDTFLDYEVTEENRDAVNAAKWIVGRDDGKGLFIFGPRGTGKTKLASIIANERMRQGRPVIFSSVPDLMADIRSTFRDGNTEEALRSVREAEFLIMDDLGAERMTEWVGEQLFGIINHRYNKRLATVITSNYSPKDIIARMADKETADTTQGERIMSRIYEVCSRVYIGGADRRSRRITA